MEINHIQTVQKANSKDVTVIFNIEFDESETFQTKKFKADTIYCELTVPDAVVQVLSDDNDCIIYRLQKLILHGYITDFMDWANKRQSITFSKTVGLKEVI